MLSVPFVTGILVAGTVSWRVLLLGLSATFLFIARESLLTWWRARRRGREAGTVRWLMLIYLGLAGLFGAPLLFQHHLFGFVPLGLLAFILLGINTEQAVRQEERTITGEVLAIIGLTLTAPTAHYVARGEWESTALWLWALNALYFTSSVFYVKLRVLSVHSRKEQARQQIERQCAFYHSFLLMALLVLALTGSLNVFALIAFAPVLMRTAWHLLKPADQLNLRRVGVLEIFYSLIFLIFITLTFNRT
jgi:hypothetical protein